MEATPSTSDEIKKRRYLENMPVFFTGLANKILEIEPVTELLCKLCNGNISDERGSIQEQLCSDCIAIPSKFEISQQATQYNIPNSSPSKSNNEERSAEKRRSLLPPPSEHTSFKPAPQNMTENAGNQLQNCNNEDSRNTFSTPTQKDLDTKWKSNSRDRKEARSKLTPYSRSSQDKKYSKQSPPGQHLLNTPTHTNGEFAQSRRYSEGQNAEFHTPSPHWSPPVRKSFEKLSREIWDIFQENKQTEEVFNRKMLLRDKLHEILQKRFESCGLYVVGSSMTGLGVKSSDIDMCLMLTDYEIDQETEAISILYNVRSLFRKYEFLTRTLVIHAKVPILKFIDTVSAIEVDLNINNAIGIRNTQLLSSYARMDDRFPPLVVLAKIWARHHDINDAKHQSLSSYSIVLMVIHFLQYGCQPPVLPCLQLIQPDKYLPHADVRKLKLHEDLPDFVSINNSDLGELFIGFLKYFSNEFNYGDSVISVRLGKIIPKDAAKQNLSPKNKEAHWKFVCIEEPFDLTNTARSVFNESVFHRIRYVFKESWNRLRRNPELRSILN